MRNISFMLTTAQFLDGSKDVTRRHGWLTAKPGDVVRAVEKSQGIPKGEKIKPLGIIRIKSVRRERLRRMMDDLEYGVQECRREGFPNWSPEAFVSFFCRSHKDVARDTTVTRIEFERIEDHG